MNAPLVFYAAATGEAATDMSQDLVTQWVWCGPDSPVSFQFGWGAGVTGTWSIEGTNAPAPTVAQSSLVDAYPISGYSAPTQPTGAADSCTISVRAANGFHRGRFTHSTGGVGVFSSGYAINAKE